MTRKLGVGEAVPQLLTQQSGTRKSQPHLVSRTTLPQLYCECLAPCPQHPRGWRLHLDTEISTMLMKERKNKTKSNLKNKDHPPPHLNPGCQRVSRSLEDTSAQGKPGHMWLSSKGDWELETLAFQAPTSGKGGHTTGLG